MGLTEALDIVFGFFPSHILEKLKSEGLYEPILSGQARDGAALYDFLKDEHAALQDADYSYLAEDFYKILRSGSVLQIGCGRGDLLFRLAKLGCAPLYGIDRSKIMLEAAEKKLENFDVKLFQEKIEDFNFEKIAPIGNVIINNFWGMISEKESAELLTKLRKHLCYNAIIAIGAPSKEKKDERLIAAEKLLQEKLGFIFSYPIFKDFGQCGYDSFERLLGQMDYFILTPKAK